jgi:hypothetical protein
MTSKITNRRFSRLFTDTAHAGGERLEADLSVVIVRERTNTQLLASYDRRTTKGVAARRTRTVSVPE